MPRIPRKYLDTSFFHIMSQGINKEYIFDNPIDIKFYIKNMYELKDKFKIKIIAYCIMNNHTHLLLQCDRVENLCKYMHSLNTRYGQYYNKKYKRVGYVFRDRYRSEGIYGEEQLNNCINYIYNNPVRAGMCKKPDQYKFSNYKKIKESGMGKNIFLDIEYDKDVVCDNIVNKFLKTNTINLDSLRKSNYESKLKELLIILKDKYNIPFRIIEKYIKINRETLRRKYNK